MLMEVTTLTLHTDMVAVILVTLQLPLPLVEVRVEAAHPLPMETVALVGVVVSCYPPMATCIGSQPTQENWNVSLAVAAPHHHHQPRSSLLGWIILVYPPSPHTNPPHAS